MVTAATILAILVFAFAWFRLLGSLREKAIRSLASKVGFQYTDRTLPSSFPSAQEAFEIAHAWNVVQGERNGTQMVVFDSVVGRGRGIYRTFIAVRTKVDPFPKDEGLLTNVLWSPEWIAICGHQAVLNLIPWTMSARRIEEYIRSLML